MAGFIKLKSESLEDQQATGDAIIRVSQSVFQDRPDSEWKKFNDDTRGWLHANGYRYDGPGAGPDGEIPSEVEIVPVYDTPNRMHVKVPWAADLVAPDRVEEEQDYGPTEEVRFRVLLARYFMRKCR